MRARVGHFLSRAVQSATVVFCISLALRLWVLHDLLPAKAYDYFYKYNEPSRIAWAMVSGFGFSSPWPNTPLLPTAQQPPGYPLLLAGIFKLFGAYTYLSLWIATGLNVVVSSFSAVMVLRLGKRDFSTPVGVLAAWTWSCWLYEAAVSVRLWESSISALLLLLALWMLPELEDSLRISKWLWFGLLAGVAGLTNPSLLAVFLPFWIWLLAGHRSDSHRSERALMASVSVFVLVLAPWTIRNYKTFHQLIPVRDNFGAELWLGNHEGLIQKFDVDFSDYTTEYARMGEILFMHAKLRIAVQFIRQHPQQFLLLTLRRIDRFWTRPEYSAWPLISLFAWAGLIVLLRRKRLRAMQFAIVMVFFPFVYYITYIRATFRQPMEPVILLLASQGVVTIIEKLAGSHLGAGDGVRALSIVAFRSS